ncbi:MAG TPA: PTS transporter subunit EIIC [Egibacteraceae bacterium]|nr:PTS transporter subunit EIIC [Egibacteraceae bacterium]
MMPIAVLPAAALLLRFGALGIELELPAQPLWQGMEAAAGAIFGNLPIIFAIGVAIGLTGGAGAAGLAAAIGHLILQAINELTVVVPEVVENGEVVEEAVTADMGVIGGIIIGLLAAWLFDRYKEVRLPDYLAFFGGRRFVPIITAFSSIGVGIVAFFVWPPIGLAIGELGEWIVGAGALGAFVYGVANRGLLPFGLHHIINTLVWFEFGTFRDPQTGEAVGGDLTRFFAGDPDAGLFMAGWFFVMMFGLPAASYAMYRRADAGNRKQTGAIMGSAGFTSFLTGITEPIEFSFVFNAPALYGIHALLSGVALVTADLLDIRHGFGFSAGVIDYLINYPLATNPLLIIPVGLVFALLYFLLFYFAIPMLDVASPGRTTRKESAAAEEPVV